MEFISSLKDAYTPEALKYIIISIILVIASRVFCSIAVNNDTKLSNIKHSMLWTAVAFVFNIAGLALYFLVRRLLKQEVPIVCTKCGKKPRKGSKKCPRCGNDYFAPRQIDNRGAVKNRILACIAIALVLEGVNYWVNNYSPYAKNEDSVYTEEYIDESSEHTDDLHYGFLTDGGYIFYDMQGNSYNKASEVPLYDEDGNKYYLDSEGSGVKSESGEVTDGSCALISSNGYFVDAAKQFGNTPNVVPFMTQDGIMYYYASSVSWDSNGNMIYTSSGVPINQ